MPKGSVQVSVNEDVRKGRWPAGAKGGAEEGGQGAKEANAKASD